MNNIEHKSLAEHGATAIDEYVGHRLRLRRENLGYSQQYTARMLGITFQQIQKYEKGSNRIGASRLYDISKLLKVNIEYFFENMPEEIFKTSCVVKYLSDEEYKEVYSTVSQNIFTANETLSLVTAYYKITNRKLARQIYDLVLWLGSLSIINEREIKTNNNI